MGENYNEILHHTAQETLESLAFLFSFSGDDDEPVQTGSLLFASVGFKGIFSGQLFLSISENILIELVQNMLGVDSDEKVPPDKQHDALRELLNVVCGNVLPSIGGKQEIFYIDVPRIMTCEEYSACLNNRTPIAETKLDLENGKAVFLLFVEGTIPSGGNGRS